MPLPSPLDYDDWRSFASALMGALTDGSGDVVASGVTGSSGGVAGVGGGGSGDAPTGLQFVYWDSSLANLFVGSSILTAPPLFSPFQIDTQSLALASVETGQLADLAITLSKLAANSVGTSNIVDGAVLSAKILDAQILTAKIVDAAILTAKIADAQIVTAKIGDLQVVTAKIADLAVNNAKIANLAVNTANIANAAITQAKIGTLAVGAANIILATIGQAQMGSASIGSAQIIDASILTADIALAQITGALIGSATIVTANIGAAQITGAVIASATITGAMIAAATIAQANMAAASIGTAQIVDASITTAKIISLVIDKVTAGTLDAVIDMGTGLIRFTVGGNTLTLGKGFGTTTQFIMWFGPTMAEATMSESTAIFYLKKDGSAYFGGTLSAGLLKNAAVATTHSHVDTSETGAFGSNGNPRTYIASIDYHWEGTTSAAGNWVGTPSYVLTIEKLISGVWTSQTSAVINGTTDGAEGPGDLTFFDINGSVTFTDSSGGLSVDGLRARVSSYTAPTWSHTTSFSAITETQRLAITSTEG